MFWTWDVCTQIELFDETFYFAFSEWVLNFLKANADIFFMWISITFKFVQYINLLIYFEIKFSDHNGDCVVAKVVAGKVGTWIKIKGTEQK